MIVAPAVKVVTPVDGLTVTVSSAVVVPHKPVEVAVMVAVPLNAPSQFITPVAASMIPADSGETV